MSAQVFLSFSASPRPPRPPPLQKEEAKAQPAAAAAAVVINHGKLFCFSPVFSRKVGGNCEKKMRKVKGAEKEGRGFEIARRRRREDGGKVLKYFLEPPLVGRFLWGIEEEGRGVRAERGLSTPPSLLSSDPSAR